MTTREKPRRGTFVVIRAASTLYALIDRNDRRRSLLLMVFNLINTLFDIVALLLIIPLVTTLSSGTAPSYLSGPNAIVSLPSWVLSNPVVAIGGLVALLFIIRAGLGTLQLWWSGGVAHRAEVDLVWRLLNGSATISYSDHLDRDSGEIFQAVTDEHQRQKERDELRRVAATPIERLLHGVEAPQAVAAVYVQKANAEVEAGRPREALALAREAARIADDAGAVRERVLARLTLARVAPR